MLIEIWSHMKPRENFLSKLVYQMAPLHWSPDRQQQCWFSTTICKKAVVVQFVQTFRLVYQSLDITLSDLPIGNPNYVESCLWVFNPKV